MATPTGRNRIVSREKWNNSVGAGWSVTLTIWRTARHQWQLYLWRDRIHRNGNHLQGLEFVRSSRPQ